MPFNSNNFDKITQFLNNYYKISNAIAPVSLIAITKNHSKNTINEAIKYGLRKFGENRVQEALVKFKNLKDQYNNLELHFVGPLQTNKVKKAIELFDYFHTLDREKLAIEFVKTLGDFIYSKKFFIQIDIGMESQKTGMNPKHADEFIKYCRDELKLNVVGLMCMPPINENPEPYFIQLRKLAYKNNLSSLSMGMSSDYEIAVNCNATHIRIGNFLFGTREK